LLDELEHPVETLAGTVYAANTATFPGFWLIACYYLLWRPLAGLSLSEAHRRGA
jgi:hypothetical protein